MLCYCCFVVFFFQASFNLFALSTYPVLFCFLHWLLNPSVCFPVLFCSFCFIPFHLLSSKRPRTSLVTHGIFLWHSFSSISLAASVTAVLYIVVIMVLMSMSLSLRPTSGVNFPHIVAWKLHAGSRSLNFSRTNLSLGWFGFLTSFRWTRKVIITRSWSLPMFAPGKLLVLWMLTPDPKCFHQSGCGVSYLGFAMSLFWMICEDQGCLSVLGCQRLQTLEVWDLSQLFQNCKMHDYLIYRHDNLLCLSLYLRKTSLTNHNGW